MRGVGLVACLVLVCAALHGQLRPIYDFNDSMPPTGNTPNPMLKLGDKLLFMWTGGLWVTDGTESGTYLLLANPLDMTPFGGQLLVGVAGALWLTDGSTAGTQLLAHFSNAGNSDVRYLHVHAGHAYFSANGGDGYELWVTDGTPQGTQQLADVNPGPANSRPGHFTSLGNLLLFTAEEAATGREPWVTDGTAGGTVRLADTNPGTGNSEIDGFVVVGNQAFFGARNAGGTRDLWVTDGTPGGTYALSSVNPAIGNWPMHLTRVGSKLYFTANTAAQGTELWKSDGTPAGTYMVSDLTPGPDPSWISHMTALGDLLVFVLGSHSNSALWCADSVASVVFELTDINPTGSPEINQLLAWNGHVYFRATDGSSGHELWRTDGTTLGTELVVDLYPGAGSSYPHTFTPSASHLYFRTGGPGTGGPAGLWRTNGTAAGTQQLSSENLLNLTSTSDRLYCIENISVGTYGIVHFDHASLATGSLVVTRATRDDELIAVGAAAGGQYVFPAGTGAVQRQVWVTDGTTAGTSEIVINPTGDANPRMFRTFGNDVYFVATISSTNRGVWRTDGTQAGTSLFMAAQTSQASVFGAHNNQLYFSLNGRLMVTDGTVAGTDELYHASINGPTSMGEITWTSQGGFFWASASGTGREPWVTDGTLAGTFMLADTLPGNSGQSVVRPFVEYNNEVYFFARNTAGYDVLWRSDGTTAGTAEFASLHTSTTDWAALRGVVGGLLLFVVDDGVHGREIWATDGTVAGTALLKDIAPGPDSALLGPVLGMIGGEQFFTLQNPTGTHELWKTDGTEAGTVFVTSLGMGLTVGGFVLPMAFDEQAHSADRVYFSSGLPLYGRELWETDGTAVGTRMVMDAVRGAGSLNPFFQGRVGNKRYFRGWHDHYGMTLWVFEPGLNINLSRTSLLYGPGSPPVTLDDSAAYTDSFGSQYDGGSLTVTIAANADADDRLTLEDQGTGAGQISLSGSDVLYEGNAVGTLQGGTGTTPLSVLFNAATDEAAIGAILRALQFHNVSASPSAGARTIEMQVEDATANLSNVATIIVEVDPVATHLVVLVPPAHSTGGVPFAVQPVIEVRAASGQLVTTYVGTVEVQIASGPAGAQLLGTVSVPVVGGVAGFTDLAIDLVGIGYELEFSSAQLTPALHFPVNIAAGPAAQAVIVNQPQTGIAGQALFPSVVVHVLDAGGNLAVSPTSVHATPEPAAGTTYPGAFGGNSSVTSSSSIIEFTNLVMPEPATDMRIRISFSMSHPPIFSVPFDITPPLAATMHIVQQPGAAVAGMPFGDQPIIELRDAQGNLATGDSVTVVRADYQYTGFPNIVSQGLRLARAVNGVATFTDLRIDTARDGLSIRFWTALLPDVDSIDFEVLPGPAFSVGQASPPDNALAGHPFGVQPVGEIRDEFGNRVVADSTSVVTVEVTPGTGTPGAVLSGTTSVQADQGLAHFTDLAIDLPGSSYRLRYSVAGLVSDSTPYFGVLSQTPDHFVIVHQPGNARRDQPFGVQPVLEVRDAQGIIVAGFSGDVEAILTAGPASTLGGTTTVTAMNGLVVFTDLSIPDAGKDYVLTFQTAGVADVDSEPFRVRGSSGSSDEGCSTGEGPGSSLLLTLVAGLLALAWFRRGLLTG